MALSPQRVLIVRLSALGDTALTLPLACLLKQRCPGLRLGWVVGERAAPLLRGVAAIDRLHVLPLGQGHPAGLRHLAREIRGQGYQAALDPQGLTVSSLLPWLAGIPQRVGFAPGPLETRELAPLLLNHRVAVPLSVTHIALRTLHLAGALGITPDTLPPVQLPLQDAAAQHIDRWWRRQGLRQDTLIMGLGAGWPTKVWPTAHAACLARAAAALGTRVVALWGPAERHELGSWAETFGGSVLLAPETDIPGMIALLLRARCYAGPDSAALHLAWLLGKPTFSWFGASDPARCAPFGPGHAHVGRGPHHWRRTALLGNPLDRLSPEEVLPVFLEWLHRLPSAG